ncbi:MAG: ACT domain-containing protein, partial [Acetobacteraceae bacterium]
PRLLPELPGRSGARSRASDGEMPIRGLISGMVVHYAGCCHPLPGDRIVGIITTGKGVTIHMRGCQTLETFAATPERFIEVEWDQEVLDKARPDQSRRGRINVIAANDPSMLATLTNAIAKHEGVVVNLKIVNRQQDFSEVLLDVEVRDLGHLSNVIAGLRAAQGVTEVSRARH